MAVVLKTSRIRVDKSRSGRVVVRSREITVRFVPGIDIRVEKQLELEAIQKAGGLRVLELLG